MEYKNVTYSFPAIFAEKNGKYDVNFIDLPIFSFGNSLADAIENAREALGLHLDTINIDSIPKPTLDISQIILKNNEIISFVSINLQEYRMKYSEKSVKKTLSIPAWLNTLAIKHNVNFSQTLQEALKKELKLDK
jgi:hypothetical protein